MSAKKAHHIWLLSQIALKVVYTIYFCSHVLFTLYPLNSQFRSTTIPLSLLAPIVPELLLFIM